MAATPLDCFAFMNTQKDILTAIIVLGGTLYFAIVFCFGIRDGKVYLPMWSINKRTSPRNYRVTLFLQALSIIAMLIASVFVIERFLISE